MQHFWWQKLKVVRLVKIRKFIKKIELKNNFKIWRNALQESCLLRYQLEEQQCKHCHRLKRSTFPQTWADELVMLTEAKLMQEKSCQLESVSHSVKIETEEGSFSSFCFKTWMCGHPKKDTGMCESLFVCRTFFELISKQGVKQSRESKQQQGGNWQNRIENCRCWKNRRAGKRVGRSRKNRKVASNRASQRVCLSSQQAIPLASLQQQGPSMLASSSGCIFCW